MSQSISPIGAVKAPFANPAATWNERFAREDFVFGREANAWLQAHSGVWKSPAKLLCVADGEGRNSVWLASSGHSVDAFDIAEVGVAKARKFAQERQVEVQFSVADCDTYAWPAAHYDGVAAIFVQFADPAMRNRMFGQITNALKPGGVLLLLGYTPKQLEYGTGGPSVLSHLYTPQILREELPDLNIQLLDEFEADIQEGTGHRGLSALIGLVARRP
ncbi:MAG: SAM-dependent methyltransferase [Burkholderiales bacterium PBB4]|nr:MAG: SAM-dependent methyltransferase [Burkholderiales bacterium PBB4]